MAITGGGQGIGRATARALSAAGAAVAVGDIEEDRAQAVAAQLSGNALAFGLDVSQPEQFGAFLHAAEARHGPLEVMVNNAGVDWVGPFHQEPDEITRREIAINLYGAALGSKLALARMLPRRAGHIVNVASGVGRVPLPGSATYSATKHGIVGLTESLRLEYRRSGIYFSVIQPSQVKTRMIEGQPTPALLPLITPEDVADAILDALRTKRFEIWVPRSQGVAMKLGGLLPRAARDAIFRVSGLTKIAGGADPLERRAYHDRAFPRQPGSLPSTGAQQSEVDQLASEVD